MVKAAEAGMVAELQISKQALSQWGVICMRETLGQLGLKVTKMPGGLNVCPDLCVDPVHLVTSLCMSHPLASNSILLITFWNSASRAERCHCSHSNQSAKRGMWLKVRWESFYYWDEPRQNNSTKYRVQDSGIW